jgi:excisionase family DNA binding protein
LTSITLSNAKKELTSKIADRLSQSMKGSAVLAPKSSVAFGTVSRALVEGLLSDRDAIVALTKLLNEAMAKETGGNDPWLKTEEAAAKMGFSRPYVNALIDAGEFGSGAAKTARGHRRVKSSAIDKWLLEHEVSPASVAQAESTDGMEEFFEVSELSPAQSNKLAKRIENARQNSMSHRPARKRA